MRILAPALALAFLAPALSPAQQFAAAPSLTATSPTTPSLKKRSHLTLSPKDDVLLRVHGTIPLGADSFSLGTTHCCATIMALAETPDLGDVTVFERNHRRYVVSSDGEPVTRLPAHITFRITASLLVHLADKPVVLDSEARLEDFLTRLRFVAHVFRHGELNSDIVAPVRTRHVGIPATIAAAERVYRADFDFGRLSVDDHIVLVVSDANGEPVTKFFLQLK